MQEKVLDPLGMRQSFYTQPAPASKTPLPATAYHIDGREVQGKYHTHPEEAAAGLWTNPSGGANEGFRSQYFASMEGGNGVVVMVNSDNGGILFEVVNSVAKVYGWPIFINRNTRPSPG